MKKLAATTGARETALLLMAPIAAAALMTGCAEEAVTIEEPQVIATEESPFSYPAALWDQDLEGETVIMVRVTEDGAVDSVYVLESSGEAAFDSVAVNGARDLRFQPGRRDDRQATMWARLPVRFHKGGAEAETDGEVEPGPEPRADSRPTTGAEP